MRTRRRRFTLQRLVRRPRREDAESGQALVEFALLLPILLFLVMGLVDFARAWQAYQVVTDAAREAARTAVVDDPTVTETDVRAVITNALTRSSLDPANASVAIDGFRSGRGNPTSVRIDFDYRLGWVGAFMVFAEGADVVTLTSEIVMRNE